MLNILHQLKNITTPSAAAEPGQLTVLEDHAICFEDEDIIDIGRESDILKKYPDANRLDGRGFMAIPGLVDPHTHPVFYQTREKEFWMRCQGKTYEEIAAAGGGIRNSARRFGEASFAELAELTYQRVTRFLEYGTTSIEAKSGYGLSLESEIRSLKILKKISKLVPISITPTFLGAHEVPDDYQDRREAYIDLVIHEMIPQVAEEKLAVFCDVFCEKNVFTVAESERILLAAKDHGLIPKIHADELHPTGGAELAARVGAISADHLLQISDQGIVDMEKAGVIPVLLPGTAFFLKKSQYAPARKMLDAGLPVAIATDYNPGSSTTHNLQLIMTLAAINMQMSPAEILCGATLNAARAIGCDREVGSLEIGKKADITLMDVPSIEVLPYHYGMNHARMVFRHGRLVHEVI